MCFNFVLAPTHREEAVSSMQICGWVCGGVSQEGDKTHKKIG